ncbi:subclass B1 metallo-beta-lactamase [Archangium violaceum]|uniref:subclass B1 metallo-beta-lactamase n=1 Tax=Archangium violaceum TaxID=83451 RepID=UPI0019529FFE|nr:subclass B1 metallo-beta-lactamase [Archangium violaceum]QRN99973.1 subclass B1 metallo-beta-lactamase [Archangium violaceum]
MNPSLFLKCHAWTLLALSLACTTPSGSTKTLPAPPAEEYRLGEDLTVRRIATGVWMHTSVASEADGGYPANGLLVEDGASSLLIDTAWEDSQTERLISWARDTLHRPIRAAVATHFHKDRLGGAPVLLAHDISVLALEETVQLARTHDKVLPSGTVTHDEKLGPLELFYPGPGHAPDNLVVWHPESGILFGGCFVKDATAKGLGNVADANVTAWPESLERTRARFPAIRTVVPGHGPIGGPELLSHTRDLLGQHLHGG